MQLTNPNSIIKIRFDGFLSCLIIEKPRVIDWPDFGGSVARYYLNLPYSKPEIESLKAIEEKLSSIRSIQELKDAGFLNLLETGEYDIELWEDKPADLRFNNNLANSNGIIHRWQKEIIGTHRSSKPFPIESFYPYGRQLMFTRPFETLDLERVKHYENLIQSGERPLAITIRVKNVEQKDEDSDQNYEDNTCKYILDGHHKLVAYKNLKINPSYFVISRLNRGLTDKFDESYLPHLNDYLFYYQIEHIVTNCLEIIHKAPGTTKYIDEILQNAPRIEDSMVRMIYRNVLDYYQTDRVKRNWFKDRLNVLINRINTRGLEIYLYDWRARNYMLEYKHVRSWGELVGLLSLE